MKIRKTIALLAAAALALSLLPAAALASWAGDDSADMGAHYFQCSGGGRMEVRCFDADGSQLGFFEKDGEYIADGVGLAGDYAAKGYTGAGDFLPVPESGEPVAVAYARETFGRFELTVIPASGFRLNRFVDPDCGCAKDFEVANGAYIVTQYSAEKIEAVFWEDDTDTGADDGADTEDEAGTDTGAAPGMTMKLDGKAVPSDVPPFIESGRTFVPVRFVSEALGAKVDWDAGTGAVTVTAGDGMVVRLIKGDTDMLVQKGGGDTTVKMDVATTVVDGRAFVPVRFIAEALGFKVGWDGRTKTVLLATGPDIMDREGALRFKQEYEALNGVLDDGGDPQYTPLSIGGDNNIVYMDFGEFIDFIENGTGLLYFGRPGCPWCRLLVPMMLEFADEDRANVFYYDIENDRAENNDSYKKVLAILGDHLPTDTVTQSEGDAGFDPGLKRVAMPQLFFLKDGKVVGGLSMFQHEFLKDNEKEKMKQLLKEKYALIAADAGDPAAPCDCE